MIRLVTLGFASVLSLGLALVGPTPARLLGSDEVGQVRGGSCTYVSWTQCTSNGGTPCSQILCVNGQCPGSIYEVAGPGLSWSTCPIDPNGYYGGCTLSGMVTCSTRWTCIGCVGGYCDRQNPFPITQPQMAGIDTCTTSG